MIKIEAQFRFNHSFYPPLLEVTSKIKNEYPFDLEGLIYYWIKIPPLTQHYIKHFSLSRGENKLSDSLILDQEFLEKIGMLWKDFSKPLEMKFMIEVAPDGLVNSEISLQRLISPTEWINLNNPKNKKHPDESKSLWEIGRLPAKKKKILEPTTIGFIQSFYEKLKPLSLPEDVKKWIDLSLKRLKEDSYSEAILSSYLASEALTSDLFGTIYGEEQLSKVRKHEDRLKRLWNDEQLEKKKLPGINVIASLLAVILWYRNKMAGHARILKPTIEAATVCLLAILQVLIEIKRLKILGI